MGKIELEKYLSQNCHGINYWFKPNIDVENNTLEYQEYSDKEFSISMQKMNDILDLNFKHVTSCFGRVSNKMLILSLDYFFQHNELMDEERLDELYSPKVLTFSSLKDCINQLSSLDAYYTLFVETPWSTTSKVVCQYLSISGNASVENQEPDSPYKYFLETTIIADELVEDYLDNIQSLDIENLFKNELLTKMIIFYAENDAHMPDEQIKAEGKLLKSITATWLKR